MQDQNAIWKFVESPLTWGGLGVVIGFAFNSPALFKVFFILGGVSVAAGLLRAGFFKNCTISKIALGNSALSLILAVVWFNLWKIIPKPPTEPPLTYSGARELLQENDRGAGEKTAPVSNEDRPITKQEFEQLIRNLPNKVTAPTTLTPDSSNNQLRLITNDITRRLSEKGKRYCDAYRIAEARVGSAVTGEQRSATLSARQQLKADFMNDPDNQRLLADANYLRDIILMRTNKASEITEASWFYDPTKQIDWNIHISELRALAQKLPQ